MCCFYREDTFDQINIMVWLKHTLHVLKVSLRLVGSLTSAFWIIYVDIKIPWHNVKQLLCATALNIKFYYKKSKIVQLLCFLCLFPAHIQLKQELFSASACPCMFLLDDVHFPPFPPVHLATNAYKKEGGDGNRYLQADQYCSTHPAQCF